MNEQKIQMEQVNEHQQNNCKIFWIKWWPNISQVLTLITLGLMLWTIAVAMFGPEQAGPESQGFRLFILFITAKICGCLIAPLNIPPMLGMLAIGVLLRNISFLQLSGQYVEFAAFLRKMALVNILLPAGLGLDPGALKRMAGMVVGLAIIPPLIEVLAVMFLSVWLMKLPWLWGLLLGLLMGAVSPAVIIPCLFELQERGYGVNKGIHTLVIASSTLDDIACIAGFGVVIGVIFSTGSLTMQILEGPIIIGLGMAYGITLGYGARFLPHHNDQYVVTLRTLVIGFGSILASVGSQAIGYAGAGTLGCIVGAFVASLDWREKGWKDRNPVKENFSLLWKFFEPISFSLIGMEVNLFILEGYTVLWGTIVMLIALLLRMFCSIIITRFSDMNVKEMLFIAMTHIPKATVQAALGPVALDLARHRTDKDLIEYANVMVIVAVMSIIITSPIGALLIMQLGPRWLHHTPPVDRQRDGIRNEAANITDDEQADTNSRL